MRLTGPLGLSLRSVCIGAVAICSLSRPIRGGCQPPRAYRHKVYRAKALRSTDARDLASRLAIGVTRPSRASSYPWIANTTSEEPMAVATEQQESTSFEEMTDEQKAIVEMVRSFVDNEILPNAEEYDHEDKFPEPIVEQMKELGLFGVTIPEEYGAMGLDLTTYAMIVEELSRGWISISGVDNTHFIGSYLLMKFGTDEQKEHFLPKMATGEIRAAFSLSEPEVGSDGQGIKSTAKKVDDGYEISGQKMWVTNGLRSAVVFVLVKTDPKADPPYKGMTCFMTEKTPGAHENDGLRVPPQIKKMGYKGVESTELVYDGYKVSPDRILGGEEGGVGNGFRQMMDALEVGRVNVAARGVGIAQRALELALRYSQQRKP